MIEAQLKKSFGGKAESAAFDLDIDLKAGEGITVLFGPSGAGKTLTLDLIAGFVKADAGRIVLDGEVLYEGKIDLPARLRRTGYVFQNYALFPHMTLRANLEFAARQRPGGPAVNELLERFRLGEVAGRRPAELSGGQKQRGSIARALVGQPRLLLLDEPTRGLDAPLRQELYSTLAGIRTPVLLVTHDLEECYALGSRMLVMQKGRVIQSGTPREIAEAPQSAEVASLLGNYNILPDGRCIQHRHVEVRPLDALRAGEVEGVVLHVYERPNGQLVEFTGHILVELPAIDRSVEKWALHFPDHSILKFSN